MGIQIEFFLRLLHRKLTRFDKGSELCTLNAERGESCSVSPTVAVAVDAALWAARRSEGLVDPTLVGELEEAGYATSRADLPSGPPSRRLSQSPPDRRAATPHPDARWQLVGVDAVAGIVTRPRGVRIDTGGSGKGLAADWPPIVSVAIRRSSSTRAETSDSAARARPSAWSASITHSQTSRPTNSCSNRGAVATSGIKTRPLAHGYRLRPSPPP